MAHEALRSQFTTEGCTADIRIAREKHSVHSTHSSSLLDTIPATSLLTPHLQRFLTALSSITMPLWRPQRSTRSSTRSGTPHGRGNRISRQRHQGALRAQGVARTARLVASRAQRVVPQTMVQLRNVLTALQHVAHLKMWRGQKVRSPFPFL